MKHVYFIRHGETEANKTRIHQNADEPLTVKGRLQAHHIAHVLELKGIDALLCSPYRRTRDTAALISEQIHVPYELEDSVVEIRRPDHLYGQSYASPDTLIYFYRLFRESEHPRWEYAGAENMYMLRSRIASTKKILERHMGESIAVVSHDVYMNLFLSYVCSANTLTLKDFMKLILRTKRTPNTAIMHFTFDPNAKKGTCAWSLVEILNPSL